MIVRAIQSLKFPLSFNRHLMLLVELQESLQQSVKKKEPKVSIPALLFHCMHALHSRLTYPTYQCTVVKGAIRLEKKVLNNHIIFECNLTDLMIQNKTQTMHQRQHLLAQNQNYAEAERIKKVCRIFIVYYTNGVVVPYEYDIWLIVLRLREGKKKQWSILLPLTSTNYYYTTRLRIDSKSVNRKRQMHHNLMQVCVITSPITSYLDSTTESGKNLRLIHSYSFSQGVSC